VGVSGGDGVGQAGNGDPVASSGIPLVLALALETINENPPPAAVQAVANLLDSLGAMKRFDEAARP
jgi:hypothetical protein